MAVDQEASQVFHDIKLAFQHLLGPLTHQITGCKPHVFLNTAQLARALASAPCSPVSRPGMLLAPRSGGGCWSSSAITLGLGWVCTGLGWTGGVGGCSWARQHGLESSSDIARFKSRHLPKKRPSSCTKAERSKRIEVRPQVKSASGPTKNHTDDLLAKEEKYKLMNAELEAKTADLVRQAEQLMRDQNEVLSKPLSTLLLSDIEDEERSRTSKASRVDDLVAGEDSADSFLANTIRSMEEKMNDIMIHESVMDDFDTAGENVGSGVSDAQIRVLKAKLGIMQEELDQFSCEYYKKDDENAKLSARIKELEEDRVRLQKTTNIQQTQIEKHRALAEESNRKCEGVQLQVSALQKEIENLNRSQKQAAAVHSSVEVRLNRALEEGERLKTQLNKMKETSKDKSSEEHQSKEHLLAENKMLKKQKAELIVGFKKQLKLIDILKRQKFHLNVTLLMQMHFEAAKLLSFTEQEFMKALDWGNFSTSRLCSSCFMRRFWAFICSKRSSSANLAIIIFLKASSSSFSACLRISLKAICSWQLLLHLPHQPLPLEAVLVPQPGLLLPLSVRAPGLLLPVLLLVLPLRHQPLLLAVRPVTTLSQWKRH
ncbi:hypothetical protein F7725_026276, partial [Dissostichus mawsoni]